MFSSSTKPISKAATSFLFLFQQDLCDAVVNLIRTKKELECHLFKKKKNQSGNLTKSIYNIAPHIACTGTAEGLASCCAEAAISSTSTAAGQIKSNYALWKDEPN